MNHVFALLIFDDENHNMFPVRLISSTDIFQLFHTRKYPLSLVIHTIARV